MTSSSHLSSNDSHYQNHYQLPDDSLLLKSLNRQSVVGTNRNDNSTTLSDADKWLLLACNNNLNNLVIDNLPGTSLANESSSSSATHPVTINDPLEIVDVLINVLHARVDAQDAFGFSTVHWLIFELLNTPRGDATIEDREVNLSQCVRYQLNGEPLLQILLACSKKQGFSCSFLHEGDPGIFFSNDDPKFENSDHTKPNIIDIQDNKGNTPLHYAVAHLRADIVGLLLAYGANPRLKNKQGQAPYDLVQWDSNRSDHGTVKVSQQRTRVLSTKQSEPGVDSDVVMEDSTFALSDFHDSTLMKPTMDIEQATSRSFSVYSSTSYSIERRYGTLDGLKIEECVFNGESASAAIKRLLFQQLLYLAVDEGDCGNAKEVKRLVDEWLKKQLDGCRMFPLAYRADVAYFDPLAIATTYESGDISNATEMLKLPILLHLQGRSRTYPCFHTTVSGFDPAPVLLLLQHGQNVNAVDSITGKTALHVLVAGHYCEEATKMIQTLLALGADPTQVDTNGNSTLTLCVWNDHLDWLKLLVEKLTDSKRNEWLLATNAYGCSVMHYALYRELPFSESNKHMVGFLISIGGTLTSPCNHAGLTPLQCWTGWRIGSRKMSEYAMIMKIDVADILSMIQLRLRKQVSEGIGKIVVDDIICNPSVSSIPLRIRSAFQFVASKDAPSNIFKYVDHFVATDESKSFVQTSRCRTAIDQRSLTEILYRFDDSPDGHPHISLSHLELRMTADRGLGVFTTRDLCVNDSMEFVGEVISVEEALVRRKEYLKRNHYAIFVEAKLWDTIRRYAVDPTNFGNVTCFLNHSCNPNLKLYSTSHGRRLVFYVLRKIKAGEELLVDYGIARDEEPEACGVCLCGEKKCRGKLICRFHTLEVTFVAHPSTLSTLWGNTESCNLPCMILKLLAISIGLSERCCGHEP